jgi:hypothetical protein
MSQRAHFWLRIVGLSLIMVAEFGPRLWSSDPAPRSTAMATAAIGR